MLDEDPEIWVSVLEPEDVYSVDITIRPRFFIIIVIIISQAAVKVNLGKGILSSVYMRNDYSWKIPSLNFSNFINKGMFIKQSPARHTDISEFGVALVAVEIEFMHQFETTYYIWAEQGPACGNQERKYSSCGNGASTENTNEGI